MRIGGVVRDYTERWLYGFTKFVGRDGHILAELLAIKEGLARCWDKGWKYIICESNCLEITEALSNGEVERNHCHKYNGILEDIHTLLRRNWCVKISHISRDANKVAG
uniref:Ribonuclease H protein At1g65750 family n=1 Tax=Cajanus cajan TaxID=3821 RepID=A0A151U8B7_CAJCA|nr:Putative ribonuclease H protein At1g65750 family [Cajanus cajan]